MSLLTLSINVMQLINFIELKENYKRTKEIKTLICLPMFIDQLYYLCSNEQNKDLCIHTYIYILYL